MSKKSKILLCVIGIFLVTSILIGISYAYYIFSVSQSGSNVVRTDCFEITYTDGNAINLTNTIPLTDKEARKLDPYTFTIKNICNQAVDYSVNIETLNTSTMSLDAVATKLDGKKKQILGSLDDNENIVNNNAASSKTIYSNILKAGEEKTHNLRLWVDDSATVEQSASKSFSSKIVINGVLHPNYSETELISGDSFNKTIKQLAGDENPTTNSSNSSITSIQRSLSAPLEDDNAINVAYLSSAKPVYAWFKDGIIYLYSDSSKVFMSINSSFMFANLNKIKNIDLSLFDTSRVTNMFRLFYYDKELSNFDVSNFDTSRVTDMEAMFAGMESLTNLDLSNFDTSNVSNMRSMFWGVNSLTNLDLSNFNTSKVTNMNSMFFDVRSMTNLNISNFDTSTVSDMSAMFAGMESLTNLDLSNFDTSNVSNMRSMFWRVNSLTNLDLSNFNTSKVTDMKSMFKEMSTLKYLDISSFNTSNVVNMGGMFDYTLSLSSIDVSNFDTSNVVYMADMFSNMTSLESLNLSNFNTKNVETMYNMFSNLNLTELDISSFETPNLKCISYMFQNCPNLRTVYVSENWNVDNLLPNEGQYTMDKGYYAVFVGDNNLVGGAGTVYNYNNDEKEYARIDDPQNGKPGYFTLKTS